MREAFPQELSPEMLAIRDSLNAVIDVAESHGILILAIVHDDKNEMTFRASSCNNGEALQLAKLLVRMSEDDYRAYMEAR